MLFIHSTHALLILSLQVLSYRAELEEPDDEDVLNWWKVNKVKFPNLARLAR